MQHLRWLGWVIAAWLLMGAAVASPPGAFSSELDSERYDCGVDFRVDAKPASDKALRVWLEWQEEGTYTQVTVLPTRVVVEALHGGQSIWRRETKLTVTPGTRHHLTALRRGAWLGLEYDGGVVFGENVPRTEGAEAGVTADAGWTLGDTQVQRLEPVAFSDNFMRTADEPGQWVTRSGRWGLQSAWDEDPHGNGNRFANTGFAQNPFAWVGRGTPGLCTTGQPFWEDYTMTAAVRPAEGGAAGFMVNMQDATHGLLIRWSPANDRGPQGDRLSLYRVSGADRQLLCEVRGGYIPGQWARLAVTSSRTGVCIATDGRQRIKYDDVTPWRGGVALYAEGDRGTVYDDVTVYGSGLNAGAMAEAEMAKAMAKFSDDGHMQEWAVADDWLSTTVPGRFVHRMDFFGDQWMVIAVRAESWKAGELSMWLHGNGSDDNVGLRAQVSFTADKKKLHYALSRDGVELAAADGDLLSAWEEYTFRACYQGDRFWLEQDGVTVVAASGIAPLSGTRAGYLATGAFYRARKGMVLGHTLRDYVFSEAPVDWIGQGTWMPTMRWACEPKWSFLGGWNRGDVVLWSKYRMTGDQSIEAFMGPKMEYPRETHPYDDRYQNFAVSLCTDGVDPRSGYYVVFGADGKDGQPNQRTVLYRKGVEVASTDVPMPTRGTSHREWFRLELHKRGNVITAKIDGGRTYNGRVTVDLSYTDPDPLTGGVPALWSWDNGIMVARARLYGANVPEPRTDAQVVLAQPDFPTWLNMGTPLALDFGASWSTSGKPVTLQVTAMPGSVAEAHAPVVAGTRIIFAPQVVGSHWYQVTATDGTNRSAPYDVFFVAVDPTRGRDDAHALVLYRFDEGTGTTIHDRSTIGDPADLVIPDNAPVQWQPGLGLQLIAGTQITSAKGVEKLGAIAQSKACTIELWTTTATMYPPTPGWCANLLSWGSSGARAQNFGVGNQQNVIALAPIGGDYEMGGAYPGAPANHFSPTRSYRIGLHHWVFTWDGTTTRAYRDGVLLPESVAMPWNTAQWVSTARLFLGNNAEGTRGFLGTYHLVAIHDRCLSDGEVQRHFQAGPNAQ